MAEKRGYVISDIYQGGFSSMDSPQPVSSGYALKDSMTTGSFGMTTDPRNANILQEVSSKLSMGVKNIEIEGVMPEVFDSIPKQQLKEINRLTKLTGIDVSLHGPVAGMNVAGMGQQGFNESIREDNERKVIDVLLRAKELRPDGNIPVNFHTSEGLPMSQLLPPSEREKDKEYKKILVVDRETGALSQSVEAETDFFPGGKKVRESVKTPEDRIKMMNDTKWKNALFQVEVNRENAERILKDVHQVVLSRFAAANSGKLDQREISQEESAQFSKIHSAQEFVEQADLAARSIFSKAYELAKEDNDEKKLKVLSVISEEYGKNLGIDGKKITSEKYFNPKNQAHALQELTNALGDPRLSLAPETFVPMEKFATKKTTQTFGNAAFETYKKLKGKNVPVLIIENPPAGQALSTGEDVKNVVEGSRKQFVDRAVKEGMSKGKAEKEAEKLIGATWDVGHINMLRKFGYEEKDIVAESEKVAHLVKHVHLSDNFGFEHTELPMGMGNVPLKEIMGKLGKKGYDAVKVIEAAGWWQHFKTPPFQETIQAIGSPIYGMKMAPYWSQTNELQESYFGGYGNMLPQINYETFGAGFSRLPQELGGASPGAQGSRMGGNPMQ